MTIKSIQAKPSQFGTLRTEEAVPTPIHVEKRVVAEEIQPLQIVSYDSLAVISHRIETNQPGPLLLGSQMSEKAEKLARPSAQVHREHHLVTEIVDYECLAVMNQSTRGQ